MRKRLFYGLLALLVASGCGKSNSILNNRYVVKGCEYTLSENENCMLCNLSNNTLLPIYAGQKNLGIIFMDTFDIVPIIINRYNDHGRLIKKPQNNASMTRISFEKGDIVTSILSNSDRGYAEVEVTFIKNKLGNPQNEEAMLCDKCFDNIMSQVDKETYGIGIINFETLDIKLLENSISSFWFDDYYIDVDCQQNLAEPEKVQ